MVLSVSRIKCYEHCPRKYKFQYVDKVKVVPNRILLKGVSVHKVFYDFFSKYSGESPMDFDRLISSFEFKVEVDNFLKFEKDRWERLSDKSKFVPIVLERNFCCDKLGFGGIVDRVDVNRLNERVLIDYKTGKVNDFKEYMFQLSAYVYLLENNGLKPIRCMIWWVSQGAYKVVLTDDFYSREVFVDRVNSFRKVLESDAKFRACPSVLCVFCDFKRLCGACKYVLVKYDSVAKKYGV